MEQKTARDKIFQGCDCQHCGLGKRFILGSTGARLVDLMGKWIVLGKGGSSKAREVVRGGVGGTRES